MKKDQQVVNGAPQIDRRSFIRSAGGVAVVMGGTAFLVGCGDGSSDTVSPVLAPQPAQPEPPRALDNRVFIDPFSPSAGSTYAYTARAKGFYEDEGLLITTIAGAGTASAVQLVAARQAFFGQAGATNLIPAIGDRDAGLVAIGQTYNGAIQFDIASLASNPIRTVEDLRGKTVGLISIGGATDVLLQLLLASAGIDPSEVQTQNTGGNAASFTFLERGDVDAIWTFPTSKLLIEDLGANLVYVNPYSLAPIPSDSIFAPSAAFDGEDTTELLRAFMRASIRGAEFVLDESNEDEVLNILGQANPIAVDNRPLASRILRETVALWRADAATELFALNERDWQNGIELMQKTGLLENTEKQLGDYISLEAHPATMS